MKIYIQKDDDDIVVGKYGCQQDFETIETDDNDVGFPVIEKGKIIEGYSKPYWFFKSGKITENEFFLHIQGLSLNAFKLQWQKTDELISMREKRKLLDIWWDNDEAEFLLALEDYKNLVEEYKQMKNECIALGGQKEKLIEYYVDKLLPRLEKLK